MTIPTEPIGSVPRPGYLMQAAAAFAAGEMTETELAERQRRALVDTVERFAETGSPVITDGEQAKPSFATYPIAGATNLAADGLVIPFADGHTRQLPRLTAGPFRYHVQAHSYLRAAKDVAQVPVKQAVISVSAMSLLYPADGIDGYPREQFVADVLDGAEADIRSSLEGGADSVQIDFTEARLSLKLDPSGGLLRTFVDLNNEVIDRFSAEERRRIGVHTCPGGDLDSTHSADVDYADLLPTLFTLRAGRFFVALAGEPDPERVLRIAAEHLPADASLFVGVVDPIDPRVETAEQVRDRVLQAARHIPVDRLGTCDDCGFSPFADDSSTSRDRAFAKIRARVDGTNAASALLGVA